MFLHINKICYCLLNFVSPLDSLLCSLSSSTSLSRTWLRLLRSPSWRRALRALIMWRGLSSPWPLRSTSAWPVREGGCRESRQRPGPRAPRSTAPLCGWEGKNRRRRPVTAAEQEMCWPVYNDMYTVQNREMCHFKHIHLSSFWTMWLCVSDTHILSEFTRLLLN